MNSQTYSTENVRAKMIEEALTLLHMVEANQSIECINEGPEARAMRFQMKAAARRLVAKMIEDIGAPERVQPRVGFFGMAV